MRNALRLVASITLAAGLFPLAGGQAAAQPGAVAAACSWTGTALPVPDGADHATVRGSRDANLIVGSYGRRGVIWRNGQPELMPRLPGGDYYNTDNVPRDINASGMVVGDNYTFSGTGIPATSRPYLHRYFYAYLPVPDVRDVHAVATNDRGDITGYSDDGNNNQKVLLWKAGSSTYQTLGTGMPVGIDEAGRVATTAGVIYNPDGTRSYLQSPSGGGVPKPVSFEHGLIAGYGSTGSGWTGIVWDVTGAVVWSEPMAFARSVNANGTVLGETATSTVNVGVWRGGVLSELVTNPRPVFSYNDLNSGYATITDDDVIISNQSGLVAPTLWRCR